MDTSDNSTLHAEGELINDLLPSPAPAPPPEPDEVIVRAEHIHKEHYYKVRSRENICKIKITNEEGQIYYIELTPESDFWKANNKYFHDDLNKFSKLINDTLVLETGDITFKILKEDFEDIVLKFIYSGLFGFECLLAVPRKKDRIDILDGEIQDLQRLNEEKDKTIIDLETRLKWVEDIIQMNLELRKYHSGPFVNFPGEKYSYQWPPLKYNLACSPTDKFKYCKGFNSNYTAGWDSGGQVSTDLTKAGMSYINTKDFSEDIENPSVTAYNQLRQAIPKASCNYRSGETDRYGYHFSDLPKWLEFLDKWKDKEPGHFEKGKDN